MKNQNIPNKDFSKSSQSEQTSSRDSQGRFEKDTSVKNSSSQSNLNKAPSRQQGQR